MKTKITMLGIRGSIPVSGSEFSEFGGATSSILVCRQNGLNEASGNGPEEAVVIDAGTGLLNIRKYLPDSVRKITVLISHVHLDHMLGLFMLPEMFSGALEIDIYSGMHKIGAGADKPDGDEDEEGWYDAKSALEVCMKPPVWPVTPAAFSKNVRFFRIPEGGTKIAGFEVTTIPGSHPGGISVFKLKTPEGKTIVHVGDYESRDDAQHDRNLAEFTRGCDVLLMDGMYSPEEYERCRGFGHSAWTDTAKMAKDVDVKTLRVLHHAPNHTDKMLKEADEYVKKNFPGYALAREGEVIEL